MLIRCKDPKDREALAVILVKNGYTVRFVTRKEKPGDKVRTSYVEIVEEVKADV